MTVLSPYQRGTDPNGENARWEEEVKAKGYVRCSDSQCPCGSGQTFGIVYHAPELTWDELCPDGAHRFYEGDDPEGFKREMKELFGFDVEFSYAFKIPAGLVEQVYGSERWPLGS